MKTVFKSNNYRLPVIHNTVPSPCCYNIETIFEKTTKDGKKQGKSYYFQNKCKQKKVPNETIESIKHFNEGIYEQIRQEYQKEADKHNKSTSVDYQVIAGNCNF